jgi:hypothetical protein
MERSPNIHRWLLWLADVDVDVQQFLPRWLGVCREHRTAVELACANFEEGAGFLDSRVLNAITSLEAPDRGLYPREVPTQQQRLRRERIAGVLDEHLSNEDRKWLKAKLQRADEPSLAERLRRLVQPVDELATWLVGNVNKWADEAATARNLLAHGMLPRNEAETEDERDYRHYWLAATAAVLAQGRLLLEAGVDPTVLAAGAGRVPRLQVLARREV